MILCQNKVCFGNTAALNEYLFATNTFYHKINTEITMPYTDVSSSIENFCAVI